MKPTENPSETNKLNPSIHPGPNQKYNPKREANAQNRDETTGLDQWPDEDFSDEGLGENSSQSGEGSGDEDEPHDEQSGAI